MIRTLLAGAVASGLVVVAVPGARAQGSPPKDLQFVGDSLRRDKDQGRLDFGRWGTGGAANDRSPTAQLRERRPKAVQIERMTPEKIVEVRKVLGDIAKGNPEAKARQEKIPAGTPQLADDLHPLEYLEYVRSLTDKEAKFAMPPSNKIKIVDQAKIAQLKAEGKSPYESLYRTIKKTIITHNLVPIIETRQLYYPG
jgi:hypothetical protein